jgi:GntR family transcriptional regulator/MocR family aminotransferase
VDFHVSLVGRKDLAGEIYRQLRQAMLDGRLQPCERLPPTRELAERLNVARSTVAVAYDRLMGEGFVTSRVGAGTFVGEHVSRATVPPMPAASALRPRPIWDDVPIRFVRSLATWQAEFDFRPGVPDASLFPFEAWRRLVALGWRASAPGLATYGDPAGHDGLRDAIAHHIGLSRGVQASAEDVTVTSGTQQALDVVARVFVAPGERVAVEDPGYPPPRRLFASLGARVAPVPVDAEGLVVEALPPDTRLVYVSPSHQFPLGMSMSLSRRLALLAWARRHDAAIVEDDYDSEFRFGARPIEPLRALDESGRVIYVGSFSKTMLPVLRLGFVVTPPSLTEAVRAAKYLTDWHTASPTQAALARFIDQGGFARHIRRMRTVYQARHRLIVDTLTHDFARHLEVVPSHVGLHVCALAPGLDGDQLAAVVDRASAAGVNVAPLSRFAVDDQRAGLPIGYGAIATDRIADGLARLRRCFDG